MFAFSNPPLPPFSKGGMIESIFPKGDIEDAKCSPSRGYHTKRHRAAPSVAIYAALFGLAIDFFKFLSQVLDHPDFHFQLTDGQRYLVPIRVNTKKFNWIF